MGRLVSTSKPGESLCGLWSLMFTLSRETVSTSKPGESLCGYALIMPDDDGGLMSQPPSLENPFVGRRLSKEPYGKYLQSQPPSLENPFVGLYICQNNYSSCDGLNLQAWRIPLWVGFYECNGVEAVGLNLQAWRIPLWANEAIAI